MTKTKRKKPKKKEKTGFDIFDVLYNITCGKDMTKWKDEEYRKVFNKYMVLRWLSMYLPYLDLANLMNKYQATVDDRVIHDSLLRALPRKFIRFNYIKKKKSGINNKKVEQVAKYFEVPNRQAEDYVKLMGENWADEIIELYGGIRK